MSGTPILQVSGLTKAFGGVLALNAVSFDLMEGELLGVIGPNGSGKTTLVNCISGFVRPSSGKVLYKGQDITHWRPHRIVRLGLARTFQMVRPFYRLPAFKNMIIPLYSPRVKGLAGRWRSIFWRRWASSGIRTSLTKWRASCRRAI